MGLQSGNLSSKKRYRMNSKPRNNTKFFSSSNIAFVIVVCASYASATTAIIYSRRPVPAWEAAVLVALGAAYLVVGTYGFAICRRSGSLLAGVSYVVVQLLLAATLILLRGSTGGYCQLNPRGNKLATQTRDSIVHHLIS